MRRSAGRSKWPIGATAVHRNSRGRAKPRYRNFIKTAVPLREPPCARAIAHHDAYEAQAYFLWPVYIVAHAALSFLYGVLLILGMT